MKHTGRPVVVDERLPLGSIARAEALADLQRRVESRAGVQVRHVAADELLVLHRYRPAWARLTGIVLALPTLGLALLFLLVRREDRANLRIEMTRDGLELSLRGCLESGLLDELRGLAAPTPAAAPAGFTPPSVFTALSSQAAPSSQSAPPSQAAPSNHAAPPSQAAPFLPSPDAGTAAFEGPGTDATVRRTSGALPGMPSVPEAAPGYLLELDSGERVPATDLVLIGRDPSRGEGEQHARLVPVDDPDRSVSKTHLSVSASPGGVWVTDRYSTNGVEVIEDGVARRLPPGTGVLVPRGAQVRFGDRRLYVT